MLSGAFALRLLAHGTCRAARRVVWRPPPGAQLLATRALKMADKGAGGKQASIASFFGGGAQPKRAVATAAASPSASGGAKRAADDATTVAGAAGELKEGAANGDAKPKAFKRLRKPAGAAADAEPAAKADSGAAGASDAVAGGSADAPVAAAAAAEPPAARALAASAVEDEEALRPSGGASAVAQALADSEDELAEEEEEEEEEDAEAAAAAAKSKGKGKASAAAKKRPAAKAKAEGGAAGVGGKSLVAAAEYLKYAPLKAAEGMWKPGDAVPFLFLARGFEACGETTKRLEISAILSNIFRSIIATTPADLLPAVYLASCAVAPQYEGVDLGIGDATLIKALAEATGRSEAAVKEAYTQEGDLGIVAQKSRANQRTMFAPPILSVRGVFTTLRDIAKTEGTKSAERKRGLIKKLLVGAREVEAGYIIRLLQGKLRVGLAQQTVVTALAHAALLQEHAAAAAAPDASATSLLSGTSLADRLGEAEAVLKQVYSECPTWDMIIPAMLQDGVVALPTTCHFVPGVPIKPMLAKATRGVAEIVERFADVEFTCEYKYDGERAQVHVMDNGEVRVFSRNLEDNTTKYPDIVSTFKAHLKPGVRSVVLDAEAVAYDRETHKILPFQVLSTRAKKGVSAEDVKIQVCLFAFDCLYADGRTLLREPLTERRRLLYACLDETEGQLQFAKERTSRDLDELSVFLEDSIAANTEGLIVKTLDATYEPSKRSLNWLKLKKDYLEGEGGGDSLDLVVIGAWHGKGKRTGVYGAFLLACYDEESETFQSICKVGTGFSEQNLKDFAEGLKPTSIPVPPPYYIVGEGPNVTPEVWFSATQVWEVKAADLSISPVHRAAAGLVDASKGIALRFPRLLRVRDDKKPEDATTSTQVAEFYRNQKINHVHGNANDDEMDE